MRLSNFKQFNESQDNIDLTQDEIKDIFVDLIDDGYSISFQTNELFELVKSFSDESVGLLNKNGITGYTNIGFIAEEYNKLTILDSIRKMLNSMGYMMAFEIVSYITTSDREIKITCQMEYDVDWVPSELSEEEIDELDDDEYDSYMRSQGYNI